MVEKIEKVMKRYNSIKGQIPKLDNKVLTKALTIIDNADGVSHEDFFEVAELLFLFDKVDEQVLYQINYAAQYNKEE